MRPDCILCSGYRTYCSNYEGSPVPGPEKDMCWDYIRLKRYFKTQTPEQIETFKSRLDEIIEDALQEKRV